MAERLCKDGVRARAYYSNMDAADRAALLADLSGGAVDALVSTSSLEAGIDLDIAAVVLVGFPVFGASSSLTQRMGRCGRREHGFAFFVPGEDVYCSYYCRHPELLLRADPGAVRHCFRPETAREHLVAAFNVRLCCSCSCSSPFV